jgi:hypothetical protein
MALPIIRDARTLGLIAEMGYRLEDFEGYYEDEIVRFLQSEKEARQARRDKQNDEMADKARWRPAHEILAEMEAEELARIRESNADAIKFRATNGVLKALIDGLSWIWVSSSNVDKIAYAEDFRRLYVKFLNGSVYSYEDVTRDVWEDFQIAPSKGKFVWDVLRGAHGVRPVPMDLIDQEYVYNRVQG